MSDEYKDPPKTVTGILKQLGPGLIITASIVGTGELIATTAAGAEAGFWLLWLIIIGCVIKVFTQVELGRYTIISGKTTMVSLSEVPGPRVRSHGNWLNWYWMVMVVFALGQGGAMVGGVGQALTISLPITDAGEQFNAVVDAEIELQVKERYLVLLGERAAVAPEQLADAPRLTAEIAATNKRLGELGDKPQTVYDDRIWAILLTIGTAIMLVVGRYRLIQTVSTVLVGTFTLITIINLFFLQSNGTLAVTPGELADGLKFRLPPTTPGASDDWGPIVTALSAFGIIGVGAAELISYPYWCVEKGYARFTGPRDDSPEWAARARGWTRVMLWDAWCSMVVYTFATVAFYFLGAAILGRFELEAKGTEMIRTLAVMYEPVFGPYAPILFLFGAIAVLYSTFFVGQASIARVFSDALRVLGLGVRTEEQRRRAIKIGSGVFPFIALSLYLLVGAPKAMILAGGFMQVIMLPMLAGAALYFRYRRSDRRLKPGRLWDTMLWVSAAGMLVVGVSAAVLTLRKFLW